MYKVVGTIECRSFFYWTLWSQLSWIIFM